MPFPTTPHGGTVPGQPRKPAVTWEAATLFGKVNVIVIEQSGYEHAARSGLKLPKKNREIDHRGFAC